MPKHLQSSPSSLVRDAFALRLQKLRRDYGERLGRRLSQSAFAAMLDIEPARLGSYERGDRTPTLEVLAALRRVTGVSLDDLISGPSAKRFLSEIKADGAMLDPAHPSTDKDFAFIRSRGSLYGSGDAWKTEADAAAGFADGWSIVANMLYMKTVSEAEAKRAAKVFTDAAWAEWHRNRSSSDGA